MRYLFLPVVLIFAVSASARQIDERAKKQILGQLEKLREAHLKSDPKLAADVYDKKLILTSQSGKKYPKRDALRNIENQFKFYENSDLEFVRLSKRVIVLNYINEREIANFPRGKFRVTAVWVKMKGNWRIASLQSSRIIVRKT